MQRPNRLSIIHGAIILFALALVGKAAYEQIYRHAYWTRVGQRQHYLASGLPAARGDILDETGQLLAESRELTRISVAQGEVKNRTVLARSLLAVGIAPAIVARALDPRHAWFDIPGAYLPTAVAGIVKQRGVYSKPVMDRVYATSGGIERIVGRVGPDGKPLDGLELTLDSLLRGDTGEVRVARDMHGKPIGAVTTDGAEPGSTVVLTLNRSLQEICDRALSDAVDSLHAAGGDIVVMNPHTGEVLAMASDRTGQAGSSNTAVTEPYEPGSTVKPFVAARLMQLGRARPDEVINTFGGHYVLDGRHIDDAEEHTAMMSLTDVIKHSSNVGIVLFGSRLNPREKYELLRDAGFGTATAVALPAESPGVLREPARWSKQSAASVMMGYEIAVTPLQLVAAYSAIANGGELVEPQIVKEVRAPDGSVTYTASPMMVRRIMTPDVAAKLRQMLRDVVTGGTSTKADLSTLDVAGKSGTARRNVHGHYEAGQYTVSFVGLFPEEQPQFVVLVKLDDPQGGGFGGVVAGGVTNIVLRAALAARDAALDRSAIASSVHAPREDTSAAARATARARAIASRHADSVAVADSLRSVSRPMPTDTDPRTAEHFVVKLPASSRAAPPVSTARPVPDVAGLPLREAVYALHAAGFRVEIVSGQATTTIPAAGTVLSAGRVVKLGAGAP